jgi:hypothetical protein
MKRFIGVSGFVVGLVACVALATSPAIAAGAARAEFGGGAGFFNSCNSEFVSGTGPITIVYIDHGDSFSVHFTFQIRNAVGNKGNTYVMNFIANGDFDAPSFIGAGFTRFDVPLHSEIVSKGGAPNFELDAIMQVFVNSSGQPVGAFFAGPSSTTCHG